MRKGIHPDYHPVVYVDTGADFELVSRSTMTSEEVRQIDGVDHYVIRLEISSASHPSISTTPTPADSGAVIENASGAAW